MRALCCDSDVLLAGFTETSMITGASVLGALSPPDPLPSTGTIAPIWLAGDFTGDGSPDILEYSTGNLKIRSNNGTGGIATATAGVLHQSDSAITAVSASLSAADMNGDGCVDIVMSTNTSGHRIFAGTCTSVAGSANVGITYPTSSQTTTVAGCNGLSVVFDANIDGCVSPTMAPAG